MCLKFGFVIFWQNDFGAKSAHKMLVKLTPGSCTIKHSEHVENGHILFLLLSIALIGLENTLAYCILCPFSVRMVYSTDPWVL